MKFFIWIAAQIDWLKSFLQEPDGKGSIKRVIMLMIVISFLRLDFKVAIANNIITDVPENRMILLLSTLGLGIASNYFYKKDPNTVSRSFVEKIKQMLSKEDK